MVGVGERLEFFYGGGLVGARQGRLPMCDDGGSLWSGGSVDMVKNNKSVDDWIAGALNLVQAYGLCGL